LVLTSFFKNFIRVERIVQAVTDIVTEMIVRKIIGLGKIADPEKSMKFSWLLLRRLPQPGVGGWFLQLSMKSKINQLNSIYYKNNSSFFKLI